MSMERIVTPPWQRGQAKGGKGGEKHEPRDPANWHQRSMIGLQNLTIICGCPEMGGTLKLDIPNIPFS